jgi:zinc protease
MRKMLLASCGLALTLGLSAASTAAAPATVAKPVWPQQQSDLQPDKEVRFGVLPNGMRYAIMKNATPPHAASLRLRIDAGSLEENEDQRGLAHFIEHMVLNGTKHVPEGEFVRRLERAGLKFGPDTNATTTFDETVYMLDLPETDASTVDTSLFLLREVADEATLADSAIDSERGIIQSEERARATPGYRIAIDQLGFLLKGDRFADRMPIGLPEVIRTAKHDRLAQFYDAYYRPDHATLIAVGDFDVAAMEAKIRAQFGTWQGNGPAGADLPPSNIQARGTEAHLIVEPGGPTSVSLNWVSPPDLRADTAAHRNERLIQQLGLQIVNRRFEHIASSGANPPFIGAGAVRANQSDRADVVQFTAIAQAGKWKEALAAIDQEQRRAVEHGFSQAEVDREISEIRAALTAAASSAATRPTTALAQGLVDAVDQDDVFTSPADDLALFEKSVKGLTADTVAQATRTLFTGGGPLVYMSSPTPIEGGDQALMAAYKTAHGVAVAAGNAQQAKAWPYAAFGTPGTVADRHAVEGLDATAIRFANGVRLTVKPTKFSNDQILVSVRVGDGLLDAPSDRTTPLWAVGAGGFVGGGLGKISYEELQQALASKVYGVSAAPGEDAFLLQGGTRPADVAIQMEVLAAYVADPAWQPNYWDRLRAYSGTIQDQLGSTPSGVFNRDAGELLHAGDRRWATPSREEMAASPIAEARQLMAKPLASGPIEIVIVGDISVDEAVKQVAATFGSLPARGRASFPATAKQIHFPAAATVRRTHGGRADQGLAFVAWPTTDFYSDQKRTRVLNLLGEVLQLRLIDEIREKQGTTYSPDAGHSPSEIFPGYGYLSAEIEAPPERLDRFLSDANKIAADLRDHPVTADELERARKPLVETLEKSRATNEWWLANLANVQDRPGVGEKIRNAISEYQAVTPADIQRAADTYLVDTKAWKMLVTPAAKAATAPAAK